MTDRGDTELDPTVAPPSSEPKPTGDSVEIALEATVAPNAASILAK